MEALLRRLDPDGLPRIDRITDVYNAVSIAHALPIGGEDRAAYAGPPRLVRATGDEPFDTTAAGEPVVEHPEAGEVVWADDDGVTCRRWNWRQCTRTRITTGTRSAVFVLDALGALADDALTAAADDLTDGLLALSPAATVTGGCSPLPGAWETFQEGGDRHLRRAQPSGTMGRRPGGHRPGTTCGLSEERRPRRPCPPVGGGMSVASTHQHPREERPEPVLITEAEPSRWTRCAARKQQYAITMAIRAASLVLAVCLLHVIPLWAVLTLAILGTFLPGFAVVMANDRPPKKRRRSVSRHEPTRGPTGTWRTSPAPRPDG